MTAHAVWDPGAKPDPDKEGLSCPFVIAFMPVLLLRALLRRATRR